MTNHCWLVFTSTFQGFLGGAKWISQPSVFLKQLEAMDTSTHCPDFGALKVAGLPAIAVAIAAELILTGPQLPVDVGRGAERKFILFCSEVGVPTTKPQ